MCSFVVIFISCKLVNETSASCRLVLCIVTVHIGRGVTKFEFDEIRILATSGVFDICQIV